MIEHTQILIAPTVNLGIEVVDRGVQSEEVICVSQGVKETVERLLDRILPEALRLPRGTGRIEVPAEAVGPIKIDQLPGVDDVPLALAHLDPILIETVAGDDAVPERGLPMDDRARGEQGVEPTSCLVDRLADEVSREALLEGLLVLERVVPLSGVHRPRVEPGIDYVRNPVHPLATFRARKFDLVDVRTMELDRAREFLIEGTFDHILPAPHRDRLFAGIADPQVERGSPVAVARQGPVLEISEEVAEPTLSDVGRIPVDCTVVRDQLLLHRSRLDVPGIHGVVEEGGVAAPAERVIVFVRSESIEDAACFQVIDDRLVGVLDKGPRAEGELLGERTGEVDRMKEGKVLFLPEEIVVLPERGSGMHDPRPLLHVDETGCVNAVGPLVV